MKLQKKIGAVGLLAAAVGGLVGSGWLFGPMYAAQLAGPAAVLSWLIGGLLMLFIGLTFAELASAFPVAGGMVRFGDMSHGPVVSFAIGWMVWLSSVVVAPIETLALLQYASNYLPMLMYQVDGIATLTHTGILVAAVLMAIMVWLNSLGAKFFSKATTSIAFIKLIVPIVTMIVLFSLDFHVNNFQTEGGFMPFGWKGVLTALPLGGVIFSFIGYSPAIQLAEEAKNPQFAIPLAIIGAILTCIILYMFLQTSFIGAMHSDFLQQGWQHLSFKDDNGPFAGILMTFGIVWLVMIIYVDAVISPFGTAYIYTASTSRVGYALSEIGLLPKSMQKLNKKGVPTRTMFMNYIVGLILFLPFPGWQSMVSFLVSCFVIAYSIGPLALYCLRQQKADYHRPFKLPAYKFMTLVAFYICNLLIFWTGWQTISKLLIAMLVGFAVFVYRYLMDEKKQWHGYWFNAWWLFAYLIVMGLLSYFGSFGGGKDYIHFGQDFGFIAVITLVIFYWAIKTGKKITDQ
jgi:amino acid transporter